MHNQAQQPNISKTLWKQVQRNIGKEKLSNGDEASDYDEVGEIDEDEEDDNDNDEERKVG